MESDVITHYQILKISKTIFLNRTTGNQQKPKISIIISKDIYLAEKLLLDKIIGFYLCTVRGFLLDVLIQIS
jgi:hypothetical protein